MKKGASVFNKGIKWLPGKENGLSLWFDKWHKKGPLRILIEGPLNCGEDHMLMRDISGFNWWRWEAISFDFSKSLALEPLYPFQPTMRTELLGPFLLVGTLFSKKLTT